MTRGRKLSVELWGSAVFGGPAVASLFAWSRAGIASRTFHRVTWANPIGHLVWLAAIAIMLRMQDSPKYRGWIPSSLPANVFFGLPFLLAFCSLALIVACIALKAGERGFAAFANGLMFVLWLSIVVAPN
jgi:hypothetical protein